MKKNFTIAFIHFFLVNFVVAQDIVSVNHLGSYTQAQIQASIPVPLIGLDFGVDAYKVNYNTTDPFGNNTVASGVLYIPSGCDNFPLISYQHGTILEKENVASRNPEDVGLLAAAFGFACTAADFLGMGDNSGTHPYIHSESEATASIDLMRAARDFMTDTLTYTLNGQVYLLGYSQGGHATMAVHKYVEDNNLLAEFDIKGSSPLSGPYDLVGVQMDMILDSSYTSPAYIAYIADSYQYVYGNLYNSPSDYYKSPYDVTIPPLLDGTHTLFELNTALPNNIFLFMEDSVMQNVIADSLTNLHPLRAALVRNSNYDWLPTRPIRMAYCDGDEQVNYMNSLKAKSTMIANGATDVDAIHILPGATHGDCALPAILNAVNWFLTTATICTPWTTNALNVDFNQSVRVFPNPANDILNIQLDDNLSNQDLMIEILDLNGRVLKQSNLTQTSNTQLSLTELSQGMYLIRVYNGQVNVWKKVVVK